MARTQQITSIKVDAPPVGGRVDRLDELPQNRLDEPGREAEVSTAEAARVHSPERLRELVKAERAQARVARSQLDLKARQLDMKVQADRRHTEALLLRLDPAVLSYEQLIRRWLDDPRVATYPNPRTHAASPTLTTGPAALPVHHSAY